MCIRDSRHTTLRVPGRGDEASRNGCCGSCSPAGLACVSEVFCAYRLQLRERVVLALRFCTTEEQQAGARRLIMRKSSRSCTTAAILRRGACVRSVWRLLLANAWSRRPRKAPIMGTELVSLAWRWPSRPQLRLAIRRYLHFCLHVGGPVVGFKRELSAPAPHLLLVHDSSARLLASEQPK